MKPTLHIDSEGQIGVIQAPEKPEILKKGRPQGWATDYIEPITGAALWDQENKKYEATLAHAIATTFIPFEDQEKVKAIIYKADGSWEDGVWLPNYANLKPSTTLFDVPVPRYEEVKFTRPKNSNLPWIPMDVDRGDPHGLMEFRTILRLLPDTQDKEAKTVYPSNEESRDRITTLIKNTMYISENWADKVHEAAKKASSLSGHPESYQSGFLAGAVWRDSYKSISELTKEEQGESQVNLWMEAAELMDDNEDYGWLLNELQSKYIIKRKVKP